MNEPPHQPPRVTGRPMSAANAGAHLIGAQVGKYRITEYMGSGSMAQVFVGEHIDMQRKVAIKVIHAEHCSSPELVSRFVNEAKALGRIQHPGVVGIIDIEQLRSGRICLIMEYLRGQNLKDLLEQHGPLPVPQAVPVMIQLADSFAAAHDQKIIHRDIKPENIYMLQEEEGWRTKLLDFGIAKLVEGAGYVQTMTRTAMGTAAYMSPEQFRSAKNVDHRTDIYSLGCVYFELLAGRPPFVGKTLVDFLRMHTAEAPPPLVSVAPHVPPPLSEIVAGMLAKNPDERFHSMAAVKAALDEFAAGRPVTSQRIPVLPQPQHQQPAPDAGRRVVVIAVVAILAIALVVLIAVLAA